MYKNILIPVVFDERHDTQASFLAARTLADDGASFTVVHALEIVPSFVASEIPADVLARTHDEIDRKLRELARALPGASSVLLSGNAGRSIVDYASENGVDCIVIASHVPGIENIFLGSTADRVVRHAKCSVHVIR